MFSSYMLGLFFLVVSVDIFVSLFPKFDVMSEVYFDECDTPECCVSCVSFTVFEGWLECQPFFQDFPHEQVSPSYLLLRFDGVLCICCHI